MQEIALKHPKNENIELYTASRKEANKTLRRGKIIEEIWKIENIDNNRYSSTKFFSNSSAIKLELKQKTRMIKINPNEKEVAEEFKIYLLINCAIPIQYLK